MFLELAAFREGRRTLFDQLVTSTLLPIESGLSRLSASVASEAYAIGHASGFASQNEALKRKVAHLAAANERIQGKGIENRELRKLLLMRTMLNASTLSADVVGYVPEAQRREITIDRGSRSGVKRDAVVVAGEGLVGHVVDVGPNDAHVLLIIDPTSTVPAYLQHTRAWGIVTGTWQHAKMKYIGQEVKVANGDLVITGQGRLYPGGIPIGRVHEVDRNDSALYQSAVVDTVTDFQALRHVLVLQKP